MLVTRRPILTFVLTGVFAAVTVAGQGLHLLIEACRSDKVACHECCPVSARGSLGSRGEHPSFGTHLLADTARDQRSAQKGKDEAKSIRRRLETLQAAP